MYRWQGRFRENCVQVAGKEQGELCTGGWEGTERTVYRWLGSNWENCEQTGRFTASEETVDRLAVYTRLAC